MAQQYWTRFAAVLLATGLLTGCGGSDSETAAQPSTAPSPVAAPTPSPSPAPSPTPTPQPAASACSVSVAGVPTSVPATNGRYPFSITATTSNCAWTARTDVQWADVSPGSGQGNATPQLNVSEWHERDPRTVNVEVNGRSYRVIQQPPSCTYSINPKTLDLGGNGGGAFVELVATDRCQWSASASESWIRVPVANGAGSTSFEIILDPNPNFSPRTGYVTVAGIRIDITQQRRPS